MCMCKGNEMKLSIWLTNLVATFVEFDFSLSDVDYCFAQSGHLFERV